MRTLSGEDSIRYVNKLRGDDGFAAKVPHALSPYKILFHFKA